ncbi:hypothetical protein N7519_008513 [Penicillium mononematosum]|uniref:uncharacterized protein n=1 Tax=Penicillium mononematosum TaxID=268346 RepID=UPI002547EF1D|nr:uncharacterized protein N7519_008513 [Penicillium mononematosum]KAJ6178052.1 hypothetical protein N7519_008513 [Penicillium mononematosum]
MVTPNPQDWCRNDKNGIVNEQDIGSETKFSISKQDGLMLLAMASLSLMAALDGTSISVTLPKMSRELGGTAIEAFWAGTSFTLCSAVFQPVFSSLSDLFGRKPLVLAAIAGFTIGTIVAGVANSFTHMLIGRSLQGIGGGGIITLTGILIADIVPLSERAKYFGMLSGIWSLGTVIGPVIGGCFAESVTWRWIFYINFPFIGIGTILVAWSPNSRVGKETFATQMRKIDIVGIALFIPSSASFLIPITWGGVLYPWDSWHTLAPLIIGLVGLCIFAFYEWRVAQHPMIPPAIFQNRTALISFAGYAGVAYNVWNRSFPETFTVAPSGGVVGLLINRTGQYYWAICIGWCLSTIGMGLLCLLGATTGTITWIFLNLVPGLGIGMVLPSVAIAVQASATAENLAIAVATSTSFRGFGQSIGVAIGGVIFQNRMKSNLLNYPALQSVADEYSGDAASAVELIRGMHGQVKTDLTQAYADSLKIVWAFCCGISGLIFIASLLTKSYDLNQTLITKQRPGNEELYKKEESPSER